MFIITSAWKGALLAQLTVTKFPERVHTFEGLQANEPYKVSEFLLFWFKNENHIIIFSTDLTTGIILCKPGIFGDRI